MFTNLKDEFKSFGISDKELKAAIEHAYEELQQCRLVGHIMSIQKSTMD